MAESVGSGGHAPHELGRRGERLAECYLRGRGWSILARNYRFGRREIDLVVRRGDLVVFVEVKTRGDTGYGGPAAAINWRKRREIEVVAADYLFRNRLGDVSVRFDVVAIAAVMSQGGGGSSTLKMLGASTGVERVLFGGAAAMVPRGLSP